MYVLQSTKYLVNKILDVINSERLFAIYYSMEISFHQILNNRFQNHILTKMILPLT